MGGSPLDPDRPVPSAEGADAGAAAASAEPTGGTAGAGASGPGPAHDPGAAPGLREQLLRTRGAVAAFARAHIDLARAEAGEIAGEIKRAVALGGMAVGCLVLLLFFLPTALLLFVGEWLFGSIGWGLLHGTLVLADIAILAVLLAIRARGLGRAAVTSALTGLVLVILLGAAAFNTLWRAIGDKANVGDGAARPLVVGVIVGAALFALIGVVLGVRASRVRGAIGGAIAGAVVGALAGAFSAITFGWQAGAGVGVAIGLLVWPVAMALEIRHEGIDAETLKARFWPQATIDTVKETIEWAKSRTPLGPTS